MLFLDKRIYKVISYISGQLPSGVFKEFPNDVIAAVHNKIPLLGADLNSLAKPRSWLSGRVNTFLNWHESAMEFIMHHA